MQDLTPSAVGTWSGGRFMHFGEPLDDDRLAALLRPGGGIGTVITADAYGAGDADPLLGRRWPASPRSDYALVGAIGHDFYEGEREGAKGFPRFTDPRLRGPDGYADYVRMATERSLERCGVDAFDLLLLHNPDRTGYTSEAVWDALERGPRRRPDAHARRRPGPGQRLHARPDRLPRALRRPDRLGDGDPQPARAVARRAGARRPPSATACELITRVVDYGGLFHDDVLPGHPFPRVGPPHASGPQGWVEAGASGWSRCARSPSATGSRRCSWRATGTSRTGRCAAWRRR